MPGVLGEGRGWPVRNCICPRYYHGILWLPLTPHPQPSTRYHKAQVPKIQGPKIRESRINLPFIEHLLKVRCYSYIIPKPQDNPQEVDMLSPFHKQETEAQDDDLGFEPTCG